ncbi:Mdm33 family-domain-containing protein [Scheffersomyces xylosifermentans]|uniref:Mdm33 family-domain-containing protein n=1 Tax=Scheffersomyces xylosifermentans TaxID=1304137 RepID=UPI00315DF3BB
MNRIVTVSSLICRSQKRSLLFGIRFQSQKAKFPGVHRIEDIQSKREATRGVPKYDDPKLTEIIESTNFGSEAIKKRAKEVERIKQNDETLRRIQAEHTLRESKEKKTEDTQEKSNEATKESQNDSSNDQIIKEESASTAEAEAGEEPSKSNNTYKDISEAIKREIGNLPSQKEELRNKYYKKLEVTLDSLQETILKATRLLNDVTGYSAIEKLKKAIQTLETELKEAKDEVKSCKHKYSEAILRRSASQREVNDLLTRKHNWTAGELERFTELYRNDHLNEQQETEAETKLSEAESRADAVQLKLTQSILTRYHEEQIWSDKIRRASTWGTWFLMGLNVFLFIIATFLVEPWKRRKLTASFEDKVRQVLVEISEADGTTLAPIIAKLSPENEPPLEETRTEHVESIKDEATPVVDPAVDAVDTIDVVVNREAVPSTSYALTFSPATWSWQDIKAKVLRDYKTLADKEIDTLQFNKTDLEIFSFVTVLLGCTIGSLLTIYFK